MPKPPLSSYKITWRPTMQNDITPSKHRRPQHPVVKAQEPIPEIAELPPTDLELIPDTIELEKPAPKKSPKKLVLWILGIFVGLVVLAVAGLYIWYSGLLAPVSNDTQKLIPLTVVSGSSPKEIGVMLQDKGIIRSSLAFEIHIRLSGNRDKLQAGSYRLKPSETTQEIVAQLVSGSVDQFSITFYPGATLNQHRKVLIDAGYSVEEVDAALVATYDSPLFEGKPASADLEGYIYGETYRFNAGASVKDILNRTFTQYLEVLQSDNLMSEMKSHGYTLYEAITLASIIQREVSSVSDRKQVAQVFYSRLTLGEPLGSDVTYQYAADKMGVERDVNLDSPYNTRRYGGLPPGPIASPGLTSLQAVGDPATGDYLYFLSGDDGKTYFGRTNAEHEANIRNHCQQKCSIL